MSNEAQAEAAGKPGFSILSNEKLLQLYRTMLECRALGELAPVASSFAGREAVVVGAARDLLPTDSLAAAPGDLFAGYLRNRTLGQPLEGLFSGTAQPSMAAQLKRALSAAAGGKKSGSGRIAAAFATGDLSGAIWSKAVARADGEGLPILFICQAPHNSQSGRIPVIPVDGHDAVAVYRVATEAITHARKGNGATIIECIFDAGGEAYALRRMEEYLTRKSLFRAAWKRKIAAEFAARLGEALSRQAC